MVQEGEGEEVVMRGTLGVMREGASLNTGGAWVFERGVIVRRPRSERTQDSRVLAARRKGAAPCSGRWEG